MNKYNFVKANRPLRHAIINQPVRISELSFEDLYRDINSQWQQKSRRMQARRWRKIRDDQTTSTRRRWAS